MSNRTSGRRRRRNEDQRTVPETFILDCHLPDDLFRCIRTGNGTVGIGLYRSGTRAFQSTRRSGRSLHVCSHNGNQPYHLRKIWGQNGSDEIYDSLRNPVCHLLSSCLSVSQSGHRTFNYDRFYHIPTLISSILSCSL